MPKWTSVNESTDVAAGSGVPTLDLPPLPPPVGGGSSPTPPPPTANSVGAYRSPQASAVPATALGAGRRHSMSPGARRAALVIGGLVLVSVCAAAYLVGNFLSSVKTINNVEQGECLKDFFDSGPDGTGQVLFVQTVGCDEPHALEVYATTDILWLGREPQGTIVDPDMLFRDGEEWCTEQFEMFIGERYETSALGMWTFVPLPRSWAQGDRTVHCVVGEYDEQTLTTGTLQHSGIFSQA